MSRKRGQVLCTSDAGLLDRVYCDESLTSINRKRHCNIRSPYDLSNLAHREQPLDSTSDSGPASDRSQDVPESDCEGPLQNLTLEWSGKIIEGLRSVQSTRDLKEPLANYLAQFYHAATSLTCDSVSSSIEEQEDPKAELSNRIGYLLQRNSVLCNVIRHQYDTIRRLQTNDMIVSTLMKEKAALSDELMRLRECVNAYIGSMTTGVSSTCQPFDSHFTRRPPDVC
ncbi:uncharacterized protein BXIN_0495 [Babesia sp. Xinjiang]|uniref:uncharacterized protein n=1 Tax=Babesia sp. Xinjiang TaxID=462227 RepID=UPI000A258FB6|nr:uncharacterized protein BXIN_0495 [Babesia sp. Xinjiang]ORM41943.1 hypothetical protein BXIN_0495 [Babesia sp. Xinjiang]